MGSVQAATDAATETGTGGSPPLEDSVPTPCVDSDPVVLGIVSVVVLEAVAVTAEVDDAPLVPAPEESDGPVPGTTPVVPDDDDAESDSSAVDVPASGSTQTSENAAGANSPYRRPAGHVSSGKLQ